jgi:hypothetical protein
VLFNAVNDAFGFVQPTLDAAAMVAHGRRMNLAHREMPSGFNGAGAIPAPHCPVMDAHEPEPR